MHQTLLLDSSFYPIQMIDWKKALTLFFTQRAEVVENHTDVIVRSTHDSYQLPKVMRLFCKVGNITSVKFNRLNVFYRDDFTCQYCRGPFKARELTLDHVIPKSKGGDTSWDNIVSACAPCNNKKADKLPHQTTMKPLKQPKEPKRGAMFILRLSRKEKLLWQDWFSFR